MTSLYECSVCGQTWEPGEHHICSRMTSNPHKGDRLTKRERFAMAAMQGLLAKPDGYSEDSKLCMAKAAIACADALLAELAKPRQ